VSNVTSVIYRAIKYRSYPNEQQTDLFAQTFGCSRKVYNMGLELQDGLYEAGMPSMSNNDLNNYCNRVWKREFEFLRDVDKFALTNAIMNLGNAFKNFFEGRAGHPKFKSRRKHDFSYTTNETNGNIAILLPTGSGRGQIKLPKVGLVDADIHRRPEEDWEIKSATISLTPSGKYYISILFKCKVDIPDIIPTLENALGLDYSSPHFYVDSAGIAADMPHWYRKAEKRLAREQRRLSRMTKGSNNYEKQRILVAKLHERVANKRKDFCHQLSREIANTYDVVCVEDIDLRNLAQSLSFGKATNDNGFGMFRRFLQYKLERQGKYYVVIDKWYPSTKTCNACGTHNPDIRLGDSTWVCPGCGRLIQRDHNAARNIRDEGFRTLTQSLQATA
jgi:putative transposase